MNIRNWPVMSSCCASCPFGPEGDKELAESVAARTGLNASQICHHPRMHGKKETHLCRGARDLQLTLLHSMGFLDHPTDECFKATSDRYLCK